MRRWDESQLNQEGLPDTEVGGVAQSQNFNASQSFRARPREGGNRDIAIRGKSGGPICIRLTCPATSKVGPGPRNCPRGRLLLVGSFLP